MHAQTNTTTKHHDLTHPKSIAAFRILRILVGAYLGVSALTLAAIIVLRDNPQIVDDAVWIRGSIVVASAAVMFAFATRMASGHRRAYLRVRILSAVMVVAIVVILFLPGTFPTWLKIEQAVCGLILIGVVIVANGRQLRSIFAGRQAS
jgi:hypothetical protein